MSTPSLKLYDLLPAAYRVRDAEAGEPLRALMAIIEEQALALKQNIDELYDDLFIETCAEWVVPYIGDLVGNNALHEVIRTRRADVARTLYYRRRKGTLAAIEELARDVTGWAMHAVEFFEVIEWTQNLNHIRTAAAPAVSAAAGQHAYPTGALDCVGTMHLRNLDVVDRVHTPFDVSSHTADVRALASGSGWHGIRKLGLFAWRLRNYPVEGTTARQAAAPNSHGYHFSPLGAPTRMFHKPQAETDEAGVSQEIHIRAPIRRTAFFLRMQDYYGPSSSLHLDVNGAVDVADILCMNLQNWERPPAGRVGVDVVLGRITFAVGEEPAEAPTVTYNYGFSGDIGAGPYDRLAPLRPGHIRDDEPARLLRAPDSAGPLFLVGPADHNTLADAVAAWVAAGRPSGTIQIEDSGVYTADVALNLNGASLAIQAANVRRPTLIGNITASGGTGAERLLLSGLLISGGLSVTGNIDRIEIAGCTLVPGIGVDENGNPIDPGAPSILIGPANENLDLMLDSTVTGAIRMPSESGTLTLRNSIVDATPEGSEPATLVPVLVSGDLAPFPALTSVTPTFRIALGDSDWFTITLAAVPATLPIARNALEAAIHAADPILASVRVVHAGSRLFLFSSEARVVLVRIAGDDPTASELLLVPPGAGRRFALRSGDLTDFSGLASAVPELGVIAGTAAPVAIPLGSSPANVNDARSAIEAALHAIAGTPAFANASVSAADNRLYLVPGEDGVAFAIRATSADPTTAVELRLGLRRPAIAGSEAGEQPGPPSTILRTTIFGASHVREITLASDSIFTEELIADRRQSGCVRFSSLPETSRSPRRFRCQPDLAVEGKTGQARTVEVTRVRPRFTSVRFADAGYAQLNSAAEIETGAENGAEMGAFNFLLQPQRRENLRLRLEEYLPFGIEAKALFRN